jgi:hypothetical protein
MQNPLTAKQMAIIMNIPPTITRGTGGRFMREMGNKYSSKRLHPKHTKKNIGGGILIAAESVKFFSINILIAHLTTKLTCRYGAQRNSGQVERLVGQFLGAVWIHFPSS